MILNPHCLIHLFKGLILYNRLICGLHDFVFEKCQLFVFIINHTKIIPEFICVIDRNNMSINVNNALGLGKFNTFQYVMNNETLPID